MFIRLKQAAFPCKPLDKTPSTATTSHLHSRPTAFWERPRGSDVVSPRMESPDEKSGTNIVARRHKRFARGLTRDPHTPREGLHILLSLDSVSVSAPGSSTRLGDE